MSRLLLVLIALLATACSSDRCRVYGNWAATGTLSSSPFLYPNGQMLRADPASATGFRAHLPSGYQQGVLFSEAFSRLDGLGTTSPLLVSQDFIDTFFALNSNVKIGLVHAASLRPVTLEALPNPPGRLRGALPQSPLEPAAEYWMTISGKPSAIPCDDGPLIVFSESDATARRVEFALQDRTPRSKRTIVVPFHTQSVTALLQEAAALAQQSDVPRVLQATAYDPLQADGTVNPELLRQFPELMRGIRYGEKPLMPFTHVGKIFTGQIDSVEYRAKGRYDAGNLRDHGHRKLDFILALPHPATTGTLPMPGLPNRPQLVIFSHPLRACKEAALGLADTLAQYGFAVAAIDHVEHGSRQSDPPSDYVCGASIPWDFFGYGDPEQLRDNVRASALDLFQFKLALQRATAADFDANGDGQLDYTADKLAVIAMSLGSIIATPFLTLAADVEVAVLNTALGSTVELLDQQSPDASRYDLPFPGPIPSLNLAVTQSILDSGEPVNYAADLRAHSRDLLIQQVVDDPVVPNASTAKFARALGVTIVEPVHRPVAGIAQAPAPYSGSPTRALYQVQYVNHSFLLIPRNEKALEPARRQVGYFLWSHFVLGRAEVIPIVFGK